MGNELWLAVGLLLILEGLGPMLIPEKWRNTLKEITLISSKTLRRVGGCFVITGIVISYAMWPMS